jgi:hypothetical protein
MNILCWSIYLHLRTKVVCFRKAVYHILFGVTTEIFENHVSDL